MPRHRCTTAMPVSSRKSSKAPGLSGAPKGLTGTTADTLPGASARILARGLGLERPAFRDRHPRSTARGRRVQPRDPSLRMSMPAPCKASPAADRRSSSASVRPTVAFVTVRPTPPPPRCGASRASNSRTSGPPLEYQRAAINSAQIGRNLIGQGQPRPRDRQCRDLRRLLVLPVGLIAQRRSPHSSSLFVRRRKASRYFAVVFSMTSRGQARPRGGLVPVERLEIIAHELLVVTLRALARRVAVGRPEARGIRRETFVDQDQLAIRSLGQIQTSYRRR